MLRRSFQVGICKQLGGSQRRVNSLAGTRVGKPGGVTKQRPIFSAGLPRVPGARRQTWNASGVALSLIAQVAVAQIVNLRRFSGLPQSHLSQVTNWRYFVIADHEIPHQLVERFMIESVLGGGYAERDMIDSREGPGIDNPILQKCDKR